MSFGTRFRPSPGASSLRSMVGGALVGIALLGGTFGAATAQDASPVACPPAATPDAAVASPVAAGWITDVAIDPNASAEGDSTTVGVTIGDVLEIMAASFETRPIVQLQANNTTDADVTAVVLTAPAEFDVTCFTLPADVSELPEGVTPYGSFEVAAGTQVTAVFPDLAPGTYIFATSSGQALTFVVTEPAAVDVPDIFASPEG